MNAPDPPPPFYDARGTVADDVRALQREFVAEQLHGTIFEAESAWRCVEIADDTGLRYHLRRAAAHLRQAVTTTNELGRPVSAATENREAAE